MNVSSLNGTSPTSATAPSRDPKQAMGRHEFLKIFVTQMKNQDPLSPMKGDELAAQLAQFSSVEQLLNLNEQFGSLVTANKESSYLMNATFAQGMIGKSVLTEGNAVQVAETGNPTVSFDVAGMGGSGVLKIYDQTGKLVGTQDLGALKSGRQSVEVDRADLPAGSYTYEVEVSGSAGTVKATTYTRLRVESVQFGQDGFVLVSGTRRIPMDNIVEIAE